MSIGEEDSPFGRLLKPYDVAKLTSFLRSSDSGVMTGSLLAQAQRIIGTLSMPDNITGKDVCTTRPPARPTPSTESSP